MIPYSLFLLIDLCSTISSCTCFVEHPNFQCHLVAPSGNWYVSVGIITNTRAAHLTWIHVVFKLSPGAISRLPLKSYGISGQWCLGFAPTSFKIDCSCNKTRPQPRPNHWPFLIGANYFSNNWEIGATQINWYLDPVNCQGRTFVWQLDHHQFSLLYQVTWFFMHVMIRLGAH